MNGNQDVIQDNDGGEAVIATRSQAIAVLIELADTRIEELSVAAKLVERNPSNAPAAVRKRAAERERLIRAKMIMKGGERDE